MRKVLELNGKPEILSIPNISMKPQNNIIFLNIQNRLSVSFISRFIWLLESGSQRGQGSRESRW